MSAQPEEERQRRAEAVRLIVTRRERAPRSPRMARALKRLIWRYLSPTDAADVPGPADNSKVLDAAREQDE
jgi:hypothetical protein